MKVLISAPSLDPGRNVSGVSTVVRHILSVLEDKIDFRHLKVGSETGTGRTGRTLRSLAASAAAAGVIFGGRYDVFHSNTALNPRSILRDAVLIVLARARRRPVVLHLHGGRYIHDDAPAFLRRIIGAMLAAAGRVIVLSGLEQSRLEANFPAARGKTEVIYNGVGIPDTPQIQRTTSDRLTIGFVGRLVDEKGIDIVLAAADRLAADPRYLFLIFGDGPRRDDVLETAKNNPNIVYRGVFDSSQTEAVFASIDVLVLPSRHGEGMPMAILEAMAAGAVPYATAISSVPEIIEDGVTGLLAPAEAADPLDRLATLADDASTLATMSRNAMSFAHTHFDARINYSRLLPIYDAVTRRA
ncbi:MAG TPA: glycosyltransferase family 4 protein [Devosia sp.]|nr:glycosyltransferase family 4 protein [Devosia sp.]